MKISSAENIDLTEEGAGVIARAAEGGMRDAVSLLELCAGLGKRIDAELVFATVGRGNRADTYSLIEKIIASDYSAVYSTIANVVMLGADLSVFWQELLDAYRDVMIVKSTADSKNYLDLTDAEHQQLARIAQEVSMAKLLYHTSVLESTLSDLQRAKESKRSVAEIALTRMCDAKLGSSPEALLLRIEELEKTVSRLKFGSFAAETQKSDNSPVAEAKVEPAVKTPEKSASENIPENSESKPYSKWGSALTEMQTAKAPLFSFLSKSIVLKNPDGSFTVKVDAFFAKIVMENAEDQAIIKGVLAELEGKSPDEIVLNIVAKSRGETVTYADEIENALENK